MTWLRRGFILFLSFVLLISLVAAVSSYGFNRTFAKPDKLKTWLADSKIYDTFVPALLNHSQKSGEEKNTSGSVSLDSPQVKTAAQKAFTPVVLQDSVDKILDSNYAWLSGKTVTPTFSVDLTSVKKAYSDEVGQVVTARLTTLPVCTPEQLAQIPIPADPLTINCRPALLDPKTEGARVAQELYENQEFLADPNVNADTLNKEDGGNPNSLPYYQDLAVMPKLYKVAVNAPWILAIIAILSAIGIIFISSERRKGALRVAIVLLITGLILIAQSLAAAASISRYEAGLKPGSLSYELKQSVNYLLHQIEPSMFKPHLWAGIAFLVIGIVTLVVLFKGRQPKLPKPVRDASVAKEAPAAPAPEPEADDSLNTRLAPRKPAPRTPAPTAPALKPKPKPSAPAGPKSLGKTPPRRKPPKLIQ